MKCFRSLIALFAILFLVMSMSDSVNAAKRSSVKASTHATWLWHTSKIVTEQKEVLSFLKSQDVNTLYLQINQEIPISEYQEFIIESNKIGVRVQALDGAAEWITPNHKGPEQFLKWVASYQNVSTSLQDFSGIHLDVEPYLLTQWTTDYQTTINQYQNLLLSVKSQAKNMQLPVYADIPFWFDEYFYSNAKFGKGLLSEWVIKNTDGIAIMAYRNFTQGQNGILALTASETNFAAKANKKVVISVETEQMDEIPYLSFYQSSQEEMNAKLAEVNKHYQNTTSFDGLAIHHYVSWKKLAEK